MPMLAKPETIAGPLGPSDLAEARAHSTGAIWLLPRRGTVMQCPPCTGPDTVPTDWHGLDACAPEGGKFADPVPTNKAKKDRPGIGIALVLAPWLAGVIGWALYMRWAA